MSACSTLKERRREEGTTLVQTGHLVVGESAETEELELAGSKLRGGDKVPVEESGEEGAESVEVELSWELGVASA